MLAFFFLLYCGSCSNVFYQPSQRQYLKPEQFKLNYQEHYFEARDKTRLHSWFFPATSPRAKGTIVLFHGNAQNLSTHFLNLVWITKEGYNLFIFDYRGYGKSEGKPHQEGVYLDALAALAKARELNQLHGQGQMIVYGQSLGGVVSLGALADFKHIEEVDLIVQDSTWGSYKKIAFDRLTSRWFLFPLSPLAYLFVSDAYASDKIISDIKRPVLVIVGMKDHIIPPEFGTELFKQLTTPHKWLWKLPQGTHIDIFHGANESYRQKFLHLLNRIDQL